jgi:hypothetical protein
MVVAVALAGVLLGMARGAGESLALKIAAPEGGFTESSVGLGVTMTNTSSKNITLVKSNPGCDFSAEVRDAEGRTVELTAAGIELMRCKQRLLLGRWIEVTLKPGEFTEESYPVELYYELKRPGTYAVRLSREVPPSAGGGVAKSNEVTMILAK